MTATRTNEEWLAALRAGEEEAVADLRERIGRGLRSALARRGRVDPADVEDLTQDGLLRVLDRLESFRGDSRLETWAMSVALRSAFATLRRKHWGDRSLDELDLPPRRERSSEEPDARAERRDLYVALRRAIDTDLTDRQRALVLSALAGMPVPKIAEELGTNPNALYKLYHDARKKLRGALESQGFGEEDVRSTLEEASRE